jgi:hypothetical protein
MFLRVGIRLLGYTVSEDLSLNTWRRETAKRRSYLTMFVSEVLTAVTTMNTMFWDVTQYSLVEVYRFFGGTYCPHLHG